MLTHGIKRVMAQNGTRALVRSRGTVLRTAVPMVNHRTFSDKGDKGGAPEPPAGGGGNMPLFLGLAALVGGGLLMSQMGGSGAEAKSTSSSKHYTTESTAKLPGWI